ncbi:cache domain-containing protein [Marinomonas fungiae]|uniref:cache domain-containing protein n=1 Tax=Marinomonas fungiae TaxID=1137284 RepID=UPI003A8D86AD
MNAAPSNNNRRWSRRRNSLRYRLLRLTLFPLLLILPGVIGLAYLWSQEVGYRQLLMKANTDLAVAHEAFLATQQQHLMRLSLLASDYRFRPALISASQTKPEPLSISLITLENTLARAAGVDYVRVLSLKGCELRTLTCGYPAQPLLDKSLREGALSGVQIFSHSELDSLSHQLAEQASVHLVAQPDRIEQRGMMLHLMQPVQNDQGETIALLAAGVLMNGNFQLVDSIRGTVYGPGSLPDNVVGTVTLFLDDVRISTNVPHPSTPQQRALGTQVSEQVKSQVLLQGQRWLDRAYVVQDWYISAYEPVLDVHNQRVGMLYAGFQEAPFLESFYTWLELLLWLFVGVLLCCVAITIRGARAISKPLESMTAAMDRVRDGERQPLPSQHSTDEVQQLALHFNDMLSQLDSQHNAIQQAAEQLEEKVNQRTQALSQRTAELQQHIVLLNRTREQLVEQGKLAALGELTAGIAHEINNPTAVILGYMDLLLDELGEQATPEIRQDAELIIAQVDRIRSIINDLLKLARPTTEQHTLTPIDVNDVVRKTQTLVKHELQRRQIRLTLELHATQLALADAPPLQQILINLIMNSANAIGQNGEIRIRSRDTGRGRIQLSVRDNGCGIAPDHLTRIFDPFFSTSHSGTGLGLSISHRLLSQIGGDIQVRSIIARGTVFFIGLQCAATSVSK